MAEAKAKSDENGMYGPEEEDKSKDEEEPEQSKNAPPGEHIVRTGENLSTISKRYKISLSDLKNINGIGKKSNRIFPGQYVKVDKAFVKFENLMNQSIEYEGQKVKLGQTPYGEWLRGELDNRRGVVDGKWGNYEYEWRSLRWVNYVPSVLNEYIHIYSNQWRSWGWEMRAFAFDRLQKHD